MKNNSPRRIPFYQVDAFSDGPFTGNPAAVCLLDAWPEDSVLQHIATENNLSETAFVVKQDDGFRIRWFTPAVEVDLCGHATLAAASVLLGDESAGDSIRFFSRSGELTVTSNGGKFTLDFPQSIPSLIEAPQGLLSALGLEEGTGEIWQAADLIVVIDDEAQLDTLNPDFAALNTFNTRGVVVTAASRTYDFRSRWFGPQVGVDEDPVTGSAHTFLAPLWSEKLGKKTLHAQQGGCRKGELICHIKDNGRIALTGEACLVIEGTFIL
ncbi:PhzF family phenazine biosynthesis protein [Enterobacter cloacae]|uniref:PhzF family phenazine biosynthesis protein n=1 Tax=Enterobacter TaxID=547 RepID=UPI0004A6DBE1|nr:MULTISPECIES: PhzF family phenazine biosynthesis protein [Enterobacter]MCU6251843.1 PhzF family phenazine biosynthesis protein [Enterobacter cloacae]HED5645186.1 PhzF family phenazine biosynthesis protein [Enterobacter cloacae]